jgi:hypothetical protein
MIASILIDAPDHGTHTIIWISEGAALERHDTDADGAVWEDACNEIDGGGRGMTTAKVAASRRVRNIA